MRTVKLAVLIVFACAAAVSAAPRMDTTRVCFDRNECVTVEIADTPDARETGLMFRERLPEGTGMLFVFDQPDYHSFWMKNTRISLDMIWIDAGGYIVDIQHGAEPCLKAPCTVYTPERSALYVLEVGSGFAREHGLKAGAPVTIGQQ